MKQFIIFMLMASFLSCTTTQPSHFDPEYAESLKALEMAKIEIEKWKKVNDGIGEVIEAIRGGTKLLSKQVQEKRIKPILETQKEPKTQKKYKPKHPVLKKADALLKKIDKFWEESRKKGIPFNKEEYERMMNEIDKKLTEELKEVIKIRRKKDGIE